MGNHTWLLQPTSPTAEPSWVSTKTRTTTDLVTSCVVTLTVCVWTAVHLNVPSYEQRTTRSGWLQRAKSKLMWMLLALFVPEIVLWTALHQFLEARVVALKLVEIDTAEEKMHPPFSQSKEATDGSPSPVSDLATSSQRTAVPDEENQLPSHPDLTISVIQESEEDKIQNIQKVELLDNIPAEDILSSYHRVLFEAWVPHADSEELPLEPTSDQKQLQVPRLWKIVKSLLRCIARYFCIIQCYLMKAITKTLSLIWDPVQKLVAKWYHFCFPPGLERGFYIVMGGYEIHRPGIEIPQESFINITKQTRRVKLFLSDSGDRRAMGYDEPWTLTPEGALSLARLGLLPKMRPEEIQDKSKADSLAKTLVCLQATWMILQCIARKAQGLPVTLLEVNTLAHVVCALLIYLLWLHKPQDVTEPTQVPPDPRLKVLQSLAMESYSLELYDSNKDLDKVKDSLEWSANVGFVSPDKIGIVVNIEKQFRLTMSHGSDAHFMPPKQEDISGFCKMVMERRVECQYGCLPFINDAALVESASNFPGSNIGHLTRNLEVEAGAGLLIATVVTAIYGGLHLISWYGHFATHLERILWRASGLLITSGGLLWYTFLILVRLPYGSIPTNFRFPYPKFEFAQELTKGVKLPIIPKLLISLLLSVRPSRPLVSLRWIYLGTILILVLLYPLARVYMVLEAFASLRSLPLGAYQTVTWAEMIPHF